jgi:hypothetical protein
LAYLHFYIYHNLTDLGYNIKERSFLRVRRTPFSTDAGKEGKSGRITVVVLKGEPGRATGSVLEEKHVTYSRSPRIYPHLPHA